MLKREEVESILPHLSDTVGWMIRLLYETGMRIMKCVRLRGKDVDFARTEIVFRQGKGAKDPHDRAAADPRRPAQRAPRQGQEASRGI